MNVVPRSKISLKPLSKIWGPLLGTIWEWLLLLLGIYLIGLISLFVCCLIKFRSHSSACEYLKTCLLIARDQAKLFSGYAFVLFAFAIPILLISSGVLIATVNGVFFNFQNEGLLIAWIIAVLAVGLLGSMGFALHQSLRDIKEDEYFKN